MKKGVVLFIVFIAVLVSISYFYIKENKQYYGCLNDIEESKNFYLAIQTNDESLCRKTNNPNTCLAFVKRNPEYCSEEAHICQAISTRDKSICEKYQDPSFKTYCEAVVENRPEKCNKIEDKEIKQECLGILGYGLERFNDENIKQSCKEKAEIVKSIKG